MSRDEWRDPNPWPAVLLFVGPLVFIIGVAWFGFAR